MTKRKDDEDKLVVALCGTEFTSCRTPLFSRWWKNTEALIQSLGLSPTHIYGDFVEKPERMTENKAYSYKRSGRRFREQVSAGNVKSLTIEAMNSKPKGLISFDWDIICDFGEDLPTPIQSLTGIDMKHLADNGKRDILQFLTQRVAEAREFFGLTYGFAAVMPGDFMPAGYAIGLTTTEAPDMLVYDTAAWRRYAGRECYRLLRNVFGYNILNTKHLDIPVGGRRLEEWIRRNKNRGLLTQIGEELFVWSFQQDADDKEFLQWDYPPVVKVRERLTAHKVFPWAELLAEEG